LVLGIGCLVLVAVAYWSLSSYRSHTAAAAAREAAVRLDAARQAQAAALVAAAERALEAGDLKTAGEEAATLAGLDAARAADLRRQIERKAGARDTNQRYAEAKVERDQLMARNLDRGQVFGEKLKALEVRWTAAEAARQAQNWCEALSGYDGVLADCREIEARETARGAASAKATAAKTAEKEADRANAVADAKALYEEGGRASSRAADFFESGDFASAAAGWDTAKAKFDSAAARSQQVQAWRKVKSDWETRLAGVAGGEAFLAQWGGVAWQAVKRDATLGATSADDPAIGKAAYERALVGLDGAVAEAQTAERRARADAALTAARAAKAAVQWQKCIEQATLASEAETGGRASTRAAVLDEAKALKNEAESHLTPSLTVEAVLTDGRTVTATMSDGQKTWQTPVTLRLSAGMPYTFLVSYSLYASQLPRYKPYALSLLADWRGPRTERVTLAETEETEGASERNVVNALRVTTPYEVQTGDTVSSIARRYGFRWQDLLAVNPGRDPRRLLVGRIIQLPGDIDTSTEIRHVPIRGPDLN
jgi:hypothetical protein